MTYVLQILGHGHFLFARKWVGTIIPPYVIKESHNKNRNYSATSPQSIRVLKVIILFLVTFVPVTLHQDAGSMVE